MANVYGRSELDTPIAKIRYPHQNIPSGYLRISITDVCNMQCSYCHNEGQIETTTSRMSIDQLRYIVTNALRFGLCKVRLTGGEPLLHPQCYDMLKFLKKEMRIPMVGFNTNGILMDRLMPIVADRLIDSLVIGVDYVDGAVSKDSPIGVPSVTILENIVRLKEMGQDVSIACVYDGDYERAERLAAWCIDHEIVLKLLQASDATVQTAIGPEFVSMARRMIDRFSLTLGVIATFSEYYGMVRGVPLIYFFHSHCRVRECEICSKIHIRVTADGFIKACILNDVKYPLLTGHFDECMLKVMCHSGRPPDTGAVRWGTPC